MLVHLFIFVVVVALVIVLKKIANPRISSVERRQDYCRAQILTNAEAEFYRFLVQLYGSQAIVCPKVRLLDLAKPKEGLSGRRFQISFNRVCAKHVDFVLLRTDDLMVFGVVELDDRTHEWKSRSERDRFVDDVLRQAGIPVCRVKVRRRYDLYEITAQLNLAFGVGTQSPAGV
jgi:very-short-patch-repair endonuclease